MAVNLAPPDPAALHAGGGPGARRGDGRHQEAGAQGPARHAACRPARRSPACSRRTASARRRCSCASNISKSKVAALVVNTGNANAGTGDDGLARARKVCDALARLSDCEPAQVLPFSTGVIMEPLPVERIVAGLPQALQAKSDWLSAAEAIMTTDTVPKACSTKVKLSSGEATVTGHRQGRGHDPARHGDHARLRRYRRDGGAAGAAAHRAQRRGPVLQLHHGRWRYLDQRLLRPDGDRCGARG